MYSVTPAFANAPFTLTTVGSKTVQTRNPLSGTLINLASGIPAVIFSYGRNSWGTSADGDAIADKSATNVDEDANNTSATSSGSPATTFISRTYTNNTSAIGGEFDDLVVWISPNILFNRMVAAGKLP
jgi:hypothetical protein